MLRVIASLPRPVLRWLEGAQFRYPWLRSLRTRMANRVKNRDGFILAGVGKGLRFNPGTSNASYLLGTAEPAVQRSLQVFLSPGMVFYDVGANVGFLSVLASRLVGPTGTVVAFEPLEANIRQIEHNARLNQAAITVIPVALSNENGLRDFVVSGSTVGQLTGSQACDLSSFKIQAVPVRRLDTIRSEQKHPPPDLIKIDVEGAEACVLEGGRAMFESERPILMIELHSTNGAVQAELNAIGYVPFVLGSAHSIAQAPPFAYVIAAPREKPDKLDAVKRVCESASAIR
jgi:FkbM family methyltransferase